MSRRPDYCPIGNEPCQSLCDTPCRIVKPQSPLSLNEIDLIVNDGMRNAAGGIYATRVYEFARAIEKAHGIEPEQGESHE